MNYTSTAIHSIHGKIGTIVSVTDTRTSQPLLASASAARQRVRRPGGLTLRRVLFVGRFCGVLIQCCLRTRRRGLFCLQITIQGTGFGHKPIANYTVKMKTEKGACTFNSSKQGETIHFGCTCSVRAAYLISHSTARLSLAQQAILWSTVRHTISSWWRLGTSRVAVVPWR